MSNICQSNIVAPYIDNQTQVNQVGLHGLCTANCSAVQFEIQGKVAITSNKICCLCQITFWRLSHGSLGIFWQKKIDFRNVHYQVLQGNKNEHVKGSLPVSTKIFIMAKLFGMSCTPNQFFSIPNEEFRD